MKINYCLKNLIDPVKKISDLRLKTDDLSIRLTKTMNHLINLKKTALREYMVGLNTLNPLHTLERGFSIARQLPSMETVKDSSILKQGDMIDIKFAKGNAECKVIKVRS